MAAAANVGPGARPPTPDELAGALGRAGVLWDDLKRRIAAAHAPIAEEWVSSGQHHPWALRLKQQKRAVVYLTPQPGWFRASFALGEKAVAAAGQAGLPPAILDLIDRAPRFAEGRAVRLEVRRATDVDVVVKLAAIKLAN